MQGFPKKNPVMTINLIHYQNRLLELRKRKLMIKSVSATRRNFDTIFSCQKFKITLQSILLRGG